MPDDGARRCRQCGHGELRDGTETLSLKLPRSAVTASARRAGAALRVLRRRSLWTARWRSDSSSPPAASSPTPASPAARRSATCARLSGLRAAELARLLDVTPETISHWETGKASPNRAAFVAVCAMIRGRARREDHDPRSAGRTGGAQRVYPRALAVKLG